MQLTEGNLYWQQNEKIKNTYPYLTYDATCDILIIGGGIVGAITAYYMAKEGMNVIVAEKNIVGYGSTSATTALLEYQVDVDLHKLEKMIGQNQARRIYKLCLDAISDIEKIDKEFKASTEFEKKDTMYYSNKFTQKASMLKEYEARKNVGFDTKFIEDHRLINFNSAILTKNSSATFNPYKFTQELFLHLSKMDNVRIFENTKIESIRPKFDGVECKTNNNFKIVADKLIFASGFETLKYVKNIPVDLYKTFTIVTNPIGNLDDFDANFTARDTVEPYHYLRFTNDNRIMFGGEDVKITEKLTNEKYLNSLANSKYKKLFGTVQKLFNNLDDLTVDYAFNGTFGNTKDSLSIIDEIEYMPNCFCNLGFGANGILYSVIGAKMLKDAVKGYYTKDMNMFKIDR